MEYTITGGSTAGFVRKDRREYQEARDRKVAAATVFFADLMKGTTPAWMLKEALQPSDWETAKLVDRNYPGLMRFQEQIATTDLPDLLGDILDRMMLARYNEAAFPLDSVAYRRRPLIDFRTVKSIAADGAEAAAPVIAENADIVSVTMTDTAYTFAPAKYGSAVDVSFESLMNDDLSVFDTVPDRLGRGARRAVHKALTSLWVGASGPTFGTGLAGNPVFDITSLQTAVATLAGAVDSGGDPIAVEGFTLVYGPALTVPVNNVMNQLSVDATEAGGVSGQRVRVNDWLVANLTPVMDAYIPIVASTANGDTTWALFSNPRAGRPALEFGQVRGFEQPALYYKQTEAVRIGGGLDQITGNWLDMAQSWKGIVTFGGTTVDALSMVYSNGSGV